MVEPSDEELRKSNESFKMTNNKTCVIGLVCDSTRLSDVRRNRIQSMHEDRPLNYTNEKEILNELEDLVFGI